MRQVVLIIACLCVVPAAASARSVVVVVGGSPSPSDLRAAVVETIAERGVRLVRTPDGEICDADPLPCAAALAARTGADATLRVEVLAEPSRVRAQLVPPEGEPVEVEVEVADEDLEGAIADAVGRALDAAPPTVGFLVVRSDPPGARVAIDGEARGTTPMRATLAPGEHDVRVSGEAGVHEATVTVVAETETSLDPVLGAPPTAEPAPVGPRQTRSAPSPFNWMIGGALAIGGVITLFSPLSTLAREGQCEESIENVGCVEMTRFGAQSGVLLGLGLAALLGAVIVDVVAPIRVEVVVGSTEARVGVRGSF